MLDSKKEELRISLLDDTFIVDNYQFTNDGDWKDSYLHHIKHELLKYIFFNDA